MPTISIITAVFNDVLVIVGEASITDLPS